MARPANDHAEVPENPAFLTDQLITCIGNKRALLGPIASAVQHVKTQLRKDRLVCFDAFAGSGVVSRFLKQHASRLVVNDLEAYAAVIARCFLTNRSLVDLDALSDTVRNLNRQVDRGGGEPGFIARLYAPQDESHIRPGERVFYTRENARRLDAFRQLIHGHSQDLLLGPLLSKASVHANTAGVFKGFYKNRDTGLGQYGGTGADALQRIRGNITLEVPVLSRFECDVEVHQCDANALAPSLGRLDFAYLDPPYNQHPYGSNYFMLNLLVHYQEPQKLSRVSGIPEDWSRSGYNRRGDSLMLLRHLIESLTAPFILISFNDEGFITTDTMTALLNEFGTIEVINARYNTFRGSRNLHGRPIHVTEQLFLLDRRHSRGTNKLRK